MSESLRVAFIITGLKTGDAERMVEKLLGSLSPSVEAFVFSLTSLGEIGPRLLTRGVPVEALGMCPGLPRPLAFERLVRRLDYLVSPRRGARVWQRPMLKATSSQLQATDCRRPNTRQRSTYDH